jgi:hypothetical protein
MGLSPVQTPSNPFAISYRKVGSPSLACKGLTKCTLCEIVLVQILYFFHVFCVSLVLILRIPMYLGIKGDPFLQTAFFSRCHFYIKIDILQFGGYCWTVAKNIIPGHLYFSLSSSVTQQLSTVTLHLPAFYLEFSSSLFCHVIQQVVVSLTWNANAKFFATSTFPSSLYIIKLHIFVQSPWQDSRKASVKASLPTRGV